MPQFPSASNHHFPDPEKAKKMKQQIIEPSPTPNPGASNFIAIEGNTTTQSTMSMASPNRYASTMSMASPNRYTQPSSAIRFLGLLAQPDSDPVPFELDESDVVWSSDQSDVHSHSPPTASNSPTSPLGRHHYQQQQQTQQNQFYPGMSGLSAALSDAHLPLVRRKPNLNPSLSAASAARTIPPVPLLRWESPSGSPAGKFAKSAPVNVPIWPKRVGELGVSSLGNFEEADEDDEAAAEEEEEEEEEMVPPHEIVARSHVMTFSVIEGVGRTLKGRDLRRVRNAVFQKTGFLD